MEDQSPAIDFAGLRKQLHGVRGQEYWRSLEEVAETESFRKLVEREFPPGAAEWWDGLSRRNFLKMAAASLALAGLNGCTKQPPQNILPYVNQPEQVIPGESLFYATSLLLGGFATGVLVKSREGHPIKVDGNPDHPASRGGSSVWMQASILDLYDPDRSQAVIHRGNVGSWTSFFSELNELRRRAESNGGRGLRLLTETSTSPSLADQIRAMLKRFPGARWHQYEPINRDNVHAGARFAFGEVVEAQYQLEQASVIVALDADFLYTHPERLRFTLDFANGRRVSHGRARMNRLYLAESTPSITGTMADHRLAISSGRVQALSQAIARGLGAPGDLPDLSSGQQKWVSTVLQELQGARGTSLVIAGEWQPPAVHALAHWINEQLGNVGKTVYYTPSAEAEPVTQVDSIRELAEEMEAGRVETLFMLGGNPAYTAPADVHFAQCLVKVPATVQLNVEFNETAAESAWHIPEAHSLEAWGDARSFDGTISLLQPLIAPLYAGKTASELLDAFLHPESPRSSYDIVREYWRKQNLWPEFERGWEQAIHDGFLANSSLPERTVTVRKEALQQTAAKPEELNLGAPESHAARPSELTHEDSLHAGLLNTARIEHGGPPPHGQELELNFRPDPSIWDGRFSNNGWLQECPKPVSKLTWDNAVLVSPALAQRAHLMNDDVVELRFQGRTVQGPVWILPGQAADSVTVHLGFGRTRTGRVGSQAGFDAYRLRDRSHLWFGAGLQIAKTGRRYHLVATQTHHYLHSPERQIFREGTLQQFAADPEFVKQCSESPPRQKTLYNPEEHPNEGYQWGMSIDLNTCIGCNACLVACEVENNIPVVGKDQVDRNREMFWIRVDTYYRGSLDDPEFRHMPVPCMHCEHAPCELVCPVEATVHDREGLNLQVYNRCVGTRFCSNNCPYKVRRFNFLRYAHYDAANFEPMYNPDVTVRWRGVMEKCTYCIQRISHARITAEKENRRIRDGEIRTACQQACPADAIVFGDLNDPDAKVGRLKRHLLDYSMLGELNTRPRTTYLAKLNNPNPQLGPSSGSA